MQPDPSTVDASTQGCCVLKTGRFVHVCWVLSYQECIDYPRTGEDDWGFDPTVTDEEACNQMSGWCN